MKSFTAKAPAMGKEQFVRYGATVGDFNPVHYDLDFERIADAGGADHEWVVPRGTI